MNTQGLELDGINTFASADFPDANETSLYEFSMAFESNYSNAVNNAVFKHYNEIKEKQSTVTESLSIIWKKKFREFLMTKNMRFFHGMTISVKAKVI